MFGALVRGICAASFALRPSGAILASRTSSGSIPVASAVTNRSVLAGCEGFDCIDRYLRIPDRAFTWKDTGLRLRGTAPDTGVACTLHILRMTSQTWLRGVSTKPKWVHHVVLVEPENLVKGGPKSGWASLILGDTMLVSEQMLAAQPDANMKVAMGLATRLGALSAVLYGVPNEFNMFSDDPMHQGVLLQEEEKAYSWMHVIDHPNKPEFMVELPNVKSVVRGMDVLQNYTAGLPAGAISSFAVSGFSKRGMATWMTAAVDSRVKAILPGAMPLHIHSMIKDLYRSYGNAPIATIPYFFRDLFGHLDDSSAVYLFKTIDAFNYMEKLSVPKFVMMTGSDDFMLVDATRPWLHKIPGETYFLMKPNREHLMQMSVIDFLPPSAAFLEGIMTNQSTPQVAWNISEDEGTITAHVGGEHVPHTVRLWTARTCKAHGRRDFRMLSNDPPATCVQCGIPLPAGCWNMVNSWNSVPIKPSAPHGRTWVVTQDAPTDNTYLAYYIDFVFEGPESNFHEPWHLSTEVAILPKGFPRGECFGDGCNGDHKMV